MNNSVVLGFYKTALAGLALCVISYALLFLVPLCVGASMLFVSSVVFTIGIIGVLCTIRPFQEKKEILSDLAFYGACGFFLSLAVSYIAAFIAALFFPAVNMYPFMIVMAAIGLFCMVACFLLLITILIQDIIETQKKKKAK